MGYIIHSDRMFGIIDGEAVALTSPISWCPSTVGQSVDLEMEDFHIVTSLGFTSTPDALELHVSYDTANYTEVG